MSDFYPIKYNEASIEDAAAQIAQLAKTIRVRPVPKNIGTYAACKFCGQLVSVSKDDLDTLESVAGAVYYATTKCTCDPAKRFAAAEQRRAQAQRERDRNLMEAQCAIEEQFGIDEDGSTIASEVVREMLMAIATMVYDHKLKATTVSINSRIKAVVAKNGKGKLIIDRKESDTSRIEIG